MTKLTVSERMTSTGRALVVPSASPVTSRPRGCEDRAPRVRSRFDRLELKYQIDESMVRTLRAEIAPYCVPDSHNLPELGGCYPIHTLYLDTPRFDFYQQKKRRELDRIKLRVRTYGPESPAVLEIKRKCGDVVQKIRATVPRDLVDAAVRGVGRPCDDTAEQWQNLDRFAFFVSSLGD